ncbi:MFS transporter [Lactiplantibacillus sp. WILCCON 0030]|uniref:MFS transporter n=1 Tax=Lactiplantibacillus brownii TaxID=3069269 RepID=A0ABU1ABU6_9LACO|nr:MFS transporter [Lactiplantibacillus brownii]MDQ7938395.1 MFS transporter [Lactiplantibacillus brownii]
MKKGWLMKFSLLSISLVLTSASVISGNIPAMAKSFPDVPLSSIEMLTTVPALMVLIFVLLSSFFAKWLGTKQTVQLGLIISLISGLIPVFSTNFTAILLSRAGLGIGFGLFNSLAVSMISYFFDGDERAKLIGFQSAFQSLGTAILAFVAGQLLKIDWHTSFWVYAIILPIIVLFTLFVPAIPKEQVREQANGTVESKSGLNPKVLGYATFLLVIIIIFSASNVKLAELVTSNGYGTPTDASNILSIMSIAGMVAGFIFGMIYKSLKKYTLPFAILAMAVAYGLFSFSNSILLTGIGALFVGFAFSIVVPYLFNQVNAIAPKGTEALSTSLLLVGANLGSSISPYGLKFLGSISGTSSVNGVYRLGAIIFVIIFVINIVFLILRRTKSIGKLNV